MKNKLSLKELKVYSFVTDESKQLRGAEADPVTVTIPDWHPSAHRTDCSDCAGCPHG